MMRMWNKAKAGAGTAVAGAVVANDREATVSKPVVAGGALARRSERTAPGTLAAAEAEAASIVRKAEEAAERAAEARKDLDEEVRAVTTEIRQLRGDLERREARIAEREQRLDDETRRVDQLVTSVDDMRKQLDARQTELDQIDAKRQSELERIAGLTAEGAKAELMAEIEQQAKREAA